MDDLLIEKHLKLVLEANKEVNITNITNWEDAYLLHVKDSLTALPELLEAEHGLYTDIGSGAGYPGIPLAIKSKRKTILVETVGKKASILKNIINQLGLSTVEVYEGRIELVNRDYPKGFSAITARALAQLSILMELASPLLKESGILICFKSHIDDNELTHALSLQKKFAMKLYSDRSISLKNHCRRIICFQKQGNPEIVLPRKVGFAQKKPF